MTWATIASQVFKAHWYTRKCRMHNLMCKTQCKGIKMKDTTWDSVISILLHFIMPLSIISTDYMQLDLLYSFFIVCMDRHKKIQVTNTQIYVCVCCVVCFYTAWRKTGSDWHYMATLGGGGALEAWAHLSCLKQAPSSCSRLFLGSHFQITRNNNNKKTE